MHYPAYPTVCECVRVYMCVCVGGGEMCVCVGEDVCVCGGGCVYVSQTVNDDLQVIDRFNELDKASGTLTHAGK
jgi:hypothetical protein